MPGRDRTVADGERTAPSPIDIAEERWRTGTPAVSGVLARSITALACLLTLFAVLYLLSD
jgi:hypothetical protein